MGLGNSIFVRVKYDFRLLIVDMQPTEEDDARKCSIAGNCLQPAVCMASS